MPNYETLTDAVSRQIESDRAAGRGPAFFCPDEAVLRRYDRPGDRASVWRTSFIHDIDKILHCPYYNRYADKTQVFSFYKNDDITRRALHVQLVSRIARTIGKALNLNADLIEAIALGHDIGHTPFGHAGERYLDQLSFAHSGRHFCHNIHSVRVLDGIYPYNISLQTLSGIASHNGELELDEYRPRPLSSFEEFDELIEGCYRDKDNVSRLIPSTLEGCVVRISDIIAYLGKDRQDAERANIVTSDSYVPGAIGAINAEIINNLMVNIIENSYGKDYIKMDRRHFEALQKAKSDNNAMIYQDKQVTADFDSTVKPMMTELYERLLSDLLREQTDSPIYTHHIAYVRAYTDKTKYPRRCSYEETEPNRLVVDYIASMTDDYFIDLHRHLFPESPYRILYKGYFD